MRQTNSLLTILVWIGAINLAVSVALTILIFAREMRERKHERDAEKYMSAARQLIRDLDKLNK